MTAPGDPLAETARQHMVLHVPTAAAGDSAETVRDGLRGRQFECLDPICVVDGQGRLEGVVTLSQLFAAPGGRPLGELAKREAPRAHPDTDQEHVATLARRHRLAAVPVVDLDDRLLGVVPPEALIEVLRREHIEDLHKLAGILRETNHAVDAAQEGPIKRLRHRLPWLLVGLAGSALATAVVARFEAALADRVAIAFFVPAIVYIADAIGTQTETITIRGLSHGVASFGHMLRAETGAGVLIGLVLGGLAVPAVLLGFGDVWLALAVGIAILIAGTIATTVGLIFPWLLLRLGVDPAYGSGPVATIIQDVLSLLTYFLVVLLLV